MADNIGYTPGTGATVAADEIGGVLHQRVKIGVGADGTAVDVSEANPLPVDIPSNSGLGFLLARILSILAAPLGYRKDTQRYQASAVLESGTVTTVSTVTTCSTVSNLVNMNGLASDRLVLNQNYSAWAAVHRARIS
jgi:hypothetical protein